MGQSSLLSPDEPGEGPGDGGDGGTTPEPEPLDVRPKTNNLKVGDTRTLTANKPVVDWTTDDNGHIISLDASSDGLTAVVKAVSTGTVRLKAKDADGLTADATINIASAEPEPEKPEPADIVVEPVGDYQMSPSGHIVIEQGKSVQFNATVLPEGADQTVRWIQFYEPFSEYFHVNDSGLVTCIKHLEGIGALLQVETWNGVLGMASITTADNGSIQKSHISVIDMVQNNEPESATMTLLRGESRGVELKVALDDDSDTIINWSTSNPDVADIRCGLVDNLGAVAAKSNGQATITAEADNGVVTNIDINVANEVPIESVTLSRDSLELKVGETASINSMILPATAPQNRTEWLSSDSAVASVTHHVGTTADVTGEAVGDTSIIFRTFDGKTCTLPVTVT